MEGEWKGRSGSGGVEGASMMVGKKSILEWGGREKTDPGYNGERY